MATPIDLILDLFYWWIYQTPANLVRFFKLYLSALNHQLSYTEIIKTFFKPWRGEYRKGLIGTAILMSVLVKTPVLLAETLILIVFLVFAVLVIVAWYLWPMVSMLLLVTDFLNVIY